MKNKGFTLTKLMVVILIVGVLTVAIPLIKASYDNAIWTYGKTGMTNIATAIRAYVKEHGTIMIGDCSIGVNNLGLTDKDLGASHFSATNYEITSISYKPEPECIRTCPNKKLKFTITGTHYGLTPKTGILDQEGTWVFSD